MANSLGKLLRRHLLWVLLALASSACGQKGPLVLPEPGQPPQQHPSPTQATPDNEK